ncbi:carbohydrate ABC transporter permease [Pseudoclavibacter caeni]|uniref:carbohydrate ABC transporter permease n=1 Tax=Pseudoclavibacter caeni TaxID=908846 RepID=UPI0017D1E06C|nr:sn-glycerol 3-phosphate transport system permease protein [Pseudoclavibacter caeni]
MSIISAPSARSGRGTPPAASPDVPRRRHRRRGRDIALFLLLAGPNIALLAVFVYRPLLQSLQYSLLQWNVGSPIARFVGAGNYLAWLTDPSTPRVLLTTAVFTVCTVAGGMALGLWLALVLDRRLPGHTIVRTVSFAPYVLSGVAVGLLWLFIFDPRYGVLAALLNAIGLPSPDWYNSQPWPLVMLIIVYIWKNVGYVALIYLAGLQAVPHEVREAAALDGATRGQTTRRVIIPLLGHTTFFLSITTLLSSLQSFDLIQAMTRGGPVGSTTTLMYEIYQVGFVDGRAGYASAVATVLFAILLAITIVQLIVMERKVNL